MTKSDCPVQGGGGGCFGQEMNRSDCPVQEGGGGRFGQERNRSDCPVQGGGWWLFWTREKQVRIFSTERRGIRFERVPEYSIVGGKYSLQREESVALDERGTGLGKK
jgi:hypothetical protein